MNEMKSVEFTFHYAHLVHGNGLNGLNIEKPIFQWIRSVSLSLSLTETTLSLSLCFVPKERPHRNEPKQKKNRHESFVSKWPALAFILRKSEWNGGAVKSIHRWRVGMRQLNLLHFMHKHTSTV